MKHFLYALFLVVLLAPFSFVHAQTPCGNIIAPVDIYDTSAPFISTPIIDCSDPFHETTTETSPYTLYVGTSTVQEGETAEVPVGGSNVYHVEGRPLLSGVNHMFFLHDGDDYRYIDTSESQLAEADYRRFALEFFPEGTDTELYVEVALTGDDSALDDEQRQNLYAFFDYVNANFVPTLPKLTAGTYTLVSKEYLLILSSQTLFQKALATVIRTAHAEEPTFPENIFTVTFTVVEVEPEPLGASSVLFLPGIQASRLYKDGLLGLEDRLWEPNGNQDLGQLAMNDMGVSQNSIYTRDIIPKAYGFVDVYAGFASFMTNLVADGVIKDWTPFAYDWRYSVVNVANNGTQYENEVRDAIDEIEYLADDSLSGKVTIIGHSNGGLLAKAIMQRLEREGKSDLVDRVVFLASPQLGTPLAIGSILHGYDQEKIGGLLMDDSIVRSISSNFPGAYSLLPSQKYFDVAPGLVIAFDSSASTQPFRTAYGDSISSEAELKSFMAGQSDGRSEATAVNEASLANSSMLEESFEQHGSVLDTWVAPAGVAVIEVVGVGLNTVTGFEYTGFTERVCEAPDVFGQQECKTKQIYKPKPFISQYGDKTVMGQSAEGYESEKDKYYVDLLAIKQNEEDIEHGNFTEHSSIQKLLKNILEEGTTTDIQFISQTKTTFDKSRIMLGAHSPVTMEVIDSTGKKVSVEYVGVEHIPQALEEVPGSSYFEVGGSKYIILPSDLDYDIVLKGIGEGGLTFTLDTLEGETQVPLISVAVATITASTTIKLSYKDQVLSNLFIDTDSDGTTDIEMTPTGDIVLPIVTYDMLRVAVTNLTLINLWKKPLLLLVGAADVFDKKSRTNVKYTQLEIFTLNQLEATLKFYVQKGLLTKLQTEEVTKIIKLLKL